MTREPASSNDYSNSARKKFEALTKLYSTNDTNPERVSFWKLGNSFDTMIDFLDTIDDSDAHDVAQMAITQLKASLKDIQGGFDGAWFDDFGWWSIATQRALQKPFFKPDVRQLEWILDECWLRFTDNAPFVWQRHDPDTFENCGPVIEGGVWNAYWLGTPEEYPGPKTGDPSSPDLVGIQNTVTNALYLMAANRLGRTCPAERRAARKELQFLRAWFEEKESSLWWEFGADTALVRERVGHFANGAPCPGFQENWAWTGDQGLILGGLSDAMLDLEPNFRGPLLDRARQLLSGVRKHLVDSRGVVQSYTATGNVPNDDVDDYQTGPGVFWRNVLHVWETNSDLRTFLASPDFQAFVRPSADAAAEAATGRSIDTLTNETAVLVAASAMLV